MLNKFNFNNIPISYKKIFLFSKIFSKKPLLYIYNFNTLKKINFYFKKISECLFNFYNNNKIYVLKFLINKSKTFKKISFRAKGKINFILKRYSNIILYTYGKKY